MRFFIVYLRCSRFIFLLCVWWFCSIYLCIFGFVCSWRDLELVLYEWCMLIDWVCFVEESSIIFCFNCEVGGDGGWWCCEFCRWESCVVWRVCYGVCGVCLYCCCKWRFFFWLWYWYFRYVYKLGREKLNFLVCWYFCVLVGE